MQTKNIIFSIIIGLVVIGGAFYAVFGSTLKNLVADDATEALPVTQVVTPATSSTTTTPKPVVTIPATPSGYTMTEIQRHNSATSSWSAINGTAYDLTSWVNSHPGGKAAILMICGKDGSPLFNSQHGGSNKIANILARFELGSMN